MGQVFQHTHYADGYVLSKEMKGDYSARYGRRVRFERADQSTVSRLIHELVAEAYLAWDKFGTTEIQFIDGNNRNCASTNLRFVAKQLDMKSRGKTIDFTKVDRGIQIKVTAATAFPETAVAIQNYARLQLTRTDDLYNPVANTNPDHHQQVNP